MTITITNKKIIDFYNKHTHLNFEQINLFLIDMLEKSVIQDAIPNSIVADMNRNMELLQKQMTEVSNNIYEQNKSIESNFVNTKELYLEQVKSILTENVSDKIIPTLKENTFTFIDKIQLIFNDLIPKNNNTIKQEFKLIINDLEKNMNKDTQSLDPNTVLSFVQNLDNKISSILSKQDNSLHELKTNQQQVSSLLNKMENSSSKGKISENMLNSILLHMFPSAAIDSVGTQKETGDVMLTRNNKPTILIENKNWERNVLQSEVQKFIRDCETQKCCGLFLSQNYGICNKDNFEINVHDGNVLLYIHSVKYNPDTIKVGIDIIDHFKSFLETIDCGTNVNTIEKSILDNIHQEYSLYRTQKETLQKMIKDTQSKLLKQVDELKLPNLEKYLSLHYAAAINIKVCDFCGYNAKSIAALSAHHRGCKIKKDSMLAIKGTSDTNTDASITINNP